MAYAIRHHFPNGTQEQYEATLIAVHGGLAADTLPEGQIIHAGGPEAGGWTIFAVHDSKESWERFRDDILVPRLTAGIVGGFEGQPEESGYELHTLLS